MPTLTDVKELFAPLGKRLYHFESKKYKTESWRYMDDLLKISYFDYQRLMEDIAKNSNLYDPNLVCEEAKYYLLRTTNILNNLEPIEKELTFFVGETRTKIATEDMKNFWSSFYVNEISCYIDNLHTIINTCEQSPENIHRKKRISPVEQQVIELPENFTVTQLNKHFDPQLSVATTTLFLYYLREKSVIPPYSDMALGKLAEVFFVRNQKNITKNLTNIYEVKESEKNLIELKKVLQALIKEIDKDINDAS